MIVSFDEDLHRVVSISDLAVPFELILLFAFPQLVITEPRFDFFETARELAVVVLQIMNLACMGFCLVDCKDLVINLALVDESKNP